MSDRFTRISNDLMDAIPYFKFNGTQFRILFCIIRYTYGFNRESHKFSLSFLSAATGIHKQQIKRELDNLIEKQVLIQVTEPGFNQPRTLKINKDFHLWEVDSCIPEGLQSANPITVNESGDSQSAKTLTPVSENAYPTVSKSAYPTVSESAYQEIHYLKTDIKTDHDDTLGHNEIQNAYFNTFGVLATQHNLEVITGYLKDGLTEWHICEALKRTAENNKRTFRYTMGILNNWLSQKAFTPEAVRELDKVHERRQSTSNRRTQSNTTEPRRTRYDPDEYREILREAGLLKEVESVETGTG